ncbi:MAG: hypothetical protein CMF62_10635 [Magnetococcales bacterium]|nr:hypothetical protein [Magnetococcales bacterium]|tara:strand:+ start:161379 stop:162185 length:807 start_codon:yes stop_codon:yes gene_type:complete
MVSTMATRPSKPKSTRRARRVDGFKIGVTLILLAFGLMGIRTYFSYIDAQVAPRIGTKASKEQTLRNLQKEEGNLGISHMTSRPLSVDMPTYSFNPRLGRTSAPIQIKIFTNPTCDLCRNTEQVLNRLTRQHISQMSMVVKIIPKPSGYNFQDVALNRAIEASLFASLAAEKDKYWDFTTKVNKQDVLTSDVYVDIMADLGITLRDVRTALAQNNERYLRQMEQDMALMKKLREEELPIVIVNDTIVEPLYGQDIAAQASEVASAFLR